MSKMGKLKSGAVTDDQGKMRLHGAFTGGFSAGYFNSVGTIEGFQPKAFVSSRNSRAENVTRTAKDYMEESDESDDSDEELVDEMLEKTGLDMGAADTTDSLPERRIAPHMKIKPSADFVNMEYSLLGDKKKTDKRIHVVDCDEPARDVYEVNNLFKRNATAADILDSSMVIGPTRDDSSQHKRKARVTSLFSSDGYSYEDGVDGVYSNDPEMERMQYTREEVGVGLHGDDEDEDEEVVGPIQERKRRKKERQLSQIHDNVEKWLGGDSETTQSADRTNDKKTKSKNKHSTDERNLRIETESVSHEDVTSQFIAPRVKSVSQTSAPVSAVATTTGVHDDNDTKSSVEWYIDYSARNDEVQHQQQQQAASRQQLPLKTPTTTLSVATKSDVNIFDLIKPSDKLKIQSIAGNSSSSRGGAVSDKLTQSISADAQAAAAMQVKLQEIQAKARLNLLNVTLAEADKATQEPVVPAARPMLSTGFKTDATFATLQEAFKNRFTAASTASTVHQDALVKEGMATASEYVAVKQLNSQASENEAASQALIEAAEKTAQEAALPTSTSGRQRNNRLKSIRTTALWAPSSLLCKRYNIKPPEITGDRAFVNDGKSKIDSMLDLIQKPQDTSYTVIHTSTSKKTKGGDDAMTGGVEGAIDSAKSEQQKQHQPKQRKEQQTHMSASDAATAMRGGVAHLLKNRFTGTSTNTPAIPPPPAPPAVPRPKTVKREHDVSGSSGVSSGNEFLGADMFSRLHTATADTSATTSPNTETPAVPVAAPPLAMFKSIFAADGDSDSDSSGDETEGEVSADVESAVQSAIETNVDTVTNRVTGCSTASEGTSTADSSCAISALDRLRDKYSSSSTSSTVPGDVSMSLPPTATSAAALAMDSTPVTSTVFIARNARVTTANKSSSAGVGGGVVIGGSSIPRRRPLSLTTAGQQQSTSGNTVRSFAIQDVENGSGEDEGTPRITSVPAVSTADKHRSSSDDEEDIPSRRKRVRQPITMRQVSAVSEVKQVVIPAVVLMPSFSVSNNNTEELSVRSLPTSATSPAVVSAAIIPPIPQSLPPTPQLQQHQHHSLVDTNAVRNERAQAAFLQSLGLQQQQQSNVISSTVNSNAITKPHTYPATSIPLQNSNPYLQPTSFNSTLRLLAADLNTTDNEMKKQKKDKKDRKKEEKKSSKHSKHKKDKKNTKDEKKSKKKKDKQKAPQTLQQSDSGSSSSSDSEFD